MTIAEMGALGEFIGSFLVAASLVALIFQVRQNTRSLNETQKIAMAQTYQDRANAAIALSMNYAMSPELIEIQHKLNVAGYPDDPSCVEQLTPQERMAMSSYLLAQKIRVDNQFYQYRQGLLDEEYFQNNFRGQISIFGPGWKMFPSPMRPSFEQQIDEVLAKSRHQ